MIYSLKGQVAGKFDQFVVIDVGGVGYKVAMPAGSLRGLSGGGVAQLFCHLHVREDALDLYGFVNPAELDFFELLIGVSGVGPKSALALLDVADLSELTAAIQEGRPDLMTKASGIGRKTAERVVLELKGKIKVGGAEETVKRMEGDSDLLETLVGLGYRKEQAKAALAKIEKDVTGLEDRLKHSLRILAGKK